MFIGHSMGGLVVANAVSYAEQQQKSYPLIFESVTATFFFGTPFHGAEIVNPAAMFASIAEKVDQGTSSKLLDIMKPGNEALRHLRENFIHAAHKLNERIRVVCFWEQEPTDFGAMPHLPSMMGLTNYVMVPKFGELVPRTSAVLESFEDYGLACNHRDLVKYDGPRDKTWSQTVREKLRENMKDAKLIAKDRVNSARGLDFKAWRKISEALGGTHIERKRKQMAATAVTSSWITDALEFREWFKMRDLEPETPIIPDDQLTNFLWIRGRQGRGKTGSVVSVLDYIESLTSGQDQSEDADGVLLAYFICEDMADYSTAEDVLRSLIIQLVDQQNPLATHAKGFIKTKVREGSYKSRKQPTVENLWQCLQDMLYDDVIGRRVYFVLHNLHALTEDSESTSKLMTYLENELQEAGRPNFQDRAWKVETRWLVTSRDTHSISKVLKGPRVCLVDLEDEKYGD